MNSQQVIMKKKGGFQHHTEKSKADLQIRGLISESEYNFWNRISAYAKYLEHTAKCQGRNYIK